MLTPERPPYHVGIGVGLGLVFHLLLFETLSCYFIINGCNLMVRYNNLTINIFLGKVYIEEICVMG